jgi:DNA-binding NarL/FixJ family response regulator
MAKGLSNKAIARKLGITEATVKVHVHRVLGKSGIHTRAKFAVKILSKLNRLLALPPRRGAKSSAPKPREFK